MSFADLDPVEHLIIGRYLNHLGELADETLGLEVHVHDGERFSYKGPFNRVEIEKQIFATNETVITVILANGHKHETMFAHGEANWLLVDANYRPQNVDLTARLIRGVKG